MPPLQPVDLELVSKLQSSSAARPLVYFSDVVKIKILLCCLRDKMSTFCDKFSRIFILLLNLTFLLLGLAQIGLGVFCHVKAKGMLDFLGNDYVNPPVIIIILGAIISVVAFCGCIERNLVCMPPIAQVGFALAISCKGVYLRVSSLDLHTPPWHIHTHPSGRKS